jgi:hypothetical protein
MQLQERNQNMATLGERGLSVIVMHFQVVPLQMIGHATHVVLVTPK